MHVLFTLPLQSLKIIFVKSTLVLLAMQFKLRRGWIGGGLSLKNPPPTIMLRAICIILLLRKKSLPEFKRLTKLLHLVHIYLHMYTHWTYLLQILSQLCFQRVAFSGNYEIVAIFSDKTTLFKDLNYKADTGQHFHKSEKSARWRHRHKIIKTNLKTHISPLLTRP